MTNIKLVLLLLPFLGGVFFAFLVYPTWSLIHCVNSKSRSDKSKIAWVVFMVLFWPLTSFIYGLFSSKKKAFQWISGICIMILIVSGTVVTYLVNWTSNMQNVWTASTVLEIDRMDTDGLTQEELTQLKESLFVVQEELNTSILRVNKKKKAFSLVRLFNFIAEDDKITPYEYSNWINKFDSRGIIDPVAFDKYIRKLKLNNN